MEAKDKEMEQSRASEPLLDAQDVNVAETASKADQLGDTSNYVLGVHLKKDVSGWNLFAVFFVFFVMTSMGGYINV